MNRVAPFICFVILLAGCTVGPDYEPPALDVPGAWSATPPQTQIDPAVELAVWWQGFGDARLSEPIHRATESEAEAAVVLDGSLQHPSA